MDQQNENALSSEEEVSGVLSEERIAVFCVGNRLMLDDGIGPAVFDELASYEFPKNVELLDVGCMSLSMVGYVESCDYIITVDAVDGTGQPAGTIFEFEPEDMARHTGAMASLHDLKLVDLFDAAQLMGYTAEGRCFGMQVENRSPEFVTEGLTPAVFNNLPLLVDTVLANLVRRGVKVRYIETGEPIRPGWHHCIQKLNDE
ncbi:hydrogenase maturation protease [Adlercreutzia sp. ZJ154]|uniref:hydrogenase maturation protease n=1 Tax=Adlercreutzia sp. ZJ154 TaxID=2709790 RepID=UPI001F153118|nr:hydrogenase maturation protease [Adlercreutzia sp. ZJ154]